MRAVCQRLVAEPGLHLRALARRGRHRLGLITVAGGPTLHLLAQTALRLGMTGWISVRRLTGAAACVLVGIIRTSIAALVVGALLVAVLIGVIVADKIAGAQRAASRAASST